MKAPFLNTTGSKFNSQLGQLNDGFYQSEELIITSLSNISVSKPLI